FQLFHPNIISLYSIFMLHWFELTISRILVFPYQEGIYPVISTDSENSVIMYTFDDTVIDFGSFENHFSFLLGAGVRARYMLLVCFALPCVAVERCFATLMVRTYEKHPRVYISTLLLVFCHLISIFLSYQTIQWKYSYFQIIITFTIALSSTITIFAFLYIYNSSVTRRLELQHRRYGYHFGKRFQAKENLKSLKV
ncbi:Protein CBG20970, partial [Caenorhabditis briggsae]